MRSVTRHSTVAVRSRFRRRPDGSAAPKRRVQQPLPIQVLFDRQYSGHGGVAIRHAQSPEQLVLAASYFAGQARRPLLHSPSAANTSPPASAQFCQPPLLAIKAAIARQAEQPSEVGGPPPAIIRPIHRAPTQPAPERTAQGRRQQHTTPPAARRAFPPPALAAEALCARKDRHGFRSTSRGEVLSCDRERDLWWKPEDVIGDRRWCCSREPRLSSNREAVFDE